MGRIIAGIGSVVAIILLIIYIFSGIDNKVLKDIDTIQKSHPNLIVKNDKEIKDFKSDPRFKKYEKYLKREKYEVKVLTLAQKIKTMSKNVATLKSIAEKNDGDDENRAIAMIHTYKTNVQILRKDTLALAGLLSRYENIDKNIKNIREKDIPTLVLNMKNNLVKYSESIKPYRVKHTNKEEDFKNRVLKFKNFYDNTVKLEKSINKSNDLFQIKKEYDEIILYNKTSNQLLKKYIDILPQLDSSYSKILSDMKMEFYVTFGMTSWDNFYDVPTEHTIYITKKVSENIFNYFYNLTTDNIGNISTSVFGRNKFYVPMQYISPLNINFKSKLPSGDDEGEIWLNDTKIKYFHKYTKESNGKRSDTGWVEVSAEMYEKHFKDLGMTILSKPYGYYEYEKIEKTIPPGMSYVGNSHYGQWQQNSNGQSFWVWYGAYRMFDDIMGNNRYSNNSYNSYRDYNNRNYGNSYYGNGGYYGTYGSYTRDRYKNSTFGRRNRSVLGNKKYRNDYKNRSANRSMRGSYSKYSTGDVRNSGSASRGRGPSGGGK